METKETYHWVSMLCPMPSENMVECLGQLQAVQKALEDAKRKDWQRWLDEYMMAVSRLIKLEDLVVSLGNLTRVMQLGLEMPPGLL